MIAPYKDLRRRYLGIDDELSIQIKDKLDKIISFKNTQRIEYDEHTILETMLENKLPQKIFHLIMSYEMNLVRDVPLIGNNLENFLNRYDRFIGDLKKNEQQLISQIGNYETCNIREAWKIHYRYSIGRFSGTTSEEIQKHGNFLNYGISWASAETVYENLLDDKSLDDLIKDSFSEYEEMCDLCDNLLD